MLRHMSLKIALLSIALTLGGFSTTVRAQSPGAQPPDRAHIRFMHFADFRWQGDPSSGQVHVNLLGDPSKFGLYIRLAKWLPNHFSRPHFHNVIRYFYVVSGTWWVSSSSHYDPSLTYPMTEGTFVTDLPNQAHFDGAKSIAAIILEIGLGPVTSTSCSKAPCP